jgi:hypothetical protein
VTAETAAPTGSDLDTQYKSLRPRARLLSTNRPRAFYGLAATEALFFLVIGTSVAVSNKVTAGIVIVVIGLLASSISLLPARWSQRNPDEAHRTVEIVRARRNRLARRHPAYFLVIVPLIVAGDAAFRWNAGHHHHTTWSWAVPAIIGLAFGLALGALVVYRARRKDTSAIHG